MNKILSLVAIAAAIGSGYYSWHQTQQYQHQMAAVRHQLTEISQTLDSRLSDVHVSVRDRVSAVDQARAVEDDRLRETMMELIAAVSKKLEQKPAPVVKKHRTEPPYVPPVQGPRPEPPAARKVPYAIEGRLQVDQ